MTHLMYNKEYIYMFSWTVWNPNVCVKLLDSQKLESRGTKEMIKPRVKGSGWTHKSLLSLCFCVFISRPLCFVVCYWGWTRLGKICPDPRPESKRGRKLRKM